MQNLNEFEELLLKVLEESLPYLKDHIDDPHVEALVRLITEVESISRPIPVSALEPCTCKSEYSIEPHGPTGSFALYRGRCPHRHGLNLCHMTEFGPNGELLRALIVRALNS